jgi:hypothetical protein
MTGAGRASLSLALAGALWAAGEGGVSAGARQDWR